MRATRPRPPLQFDYPKNIMHNIYGSTSQHNSTLTPAITSINCLIHLLEKHQARIQPDSWCHTDWKFMSLQKKNLPDNYNVMLSVTRLNCRQHSATITAHILLF
jgi:hypothetical protein